MWKLSYSWKRCWCCSIVPNDPISDFWGLLKLGKILEVIDIQWWQFYFSLCTQHRHDELAVVSSASSPVFAGFVLVNHGSHYWSAYPGSLQYSFLVGTFVCFSYRHLLVQFLRQPSLFTELQRTITIAVPVYLLTCFDVGRDNYFLCSPWMLQSVLWL